MTRDIVTEANANMARTFEHIADHVSGGATRRHGAALAVSAGLPLSVYNQIFAFDAPPDDIAAAVAWMRARDVPFLVGVTDGEHERVQEVDAALALLDDPELGLAHRSLDAVPADEGRVDVTGVSGSDDFADFVTVYTAVFGRAERVAERVHRAVAAADGADLYVGRVDGRPVASGVLVRTGDVAGIYTVGVVEPFRGRGIGKATTRALLRAGRADGCEVAVVQAEASVAPLYEDLGFEPVVRYRYFQPTG
ncbi:GNAT family N-acetyltransferase [Halomicroarcula sp. GCM10025817]|uniref:GNAT family N-acetyltransferase n=1 Tax=Haloarcula TaxID=2237 RepID=UPI0023E81700|nr:GNAT family N-acetyltransferase [Halomicroarcula sp. SYNS111]